MINFIVLNMIFLIWNRKLVMEKLILFREVRLMLVMMKRMLRKCLSEGFLIFQVQVVSRIVMGVVVLSIWMKVIERQRQIMLEQIRLVEQRRLMGMMVWRQMWLVILMFLWLLRRWVVWVRIWVVMVVKMRCQQVRIMVGFGGLIFIQCVSVGCMYDIL